MFGSKGQLAELEWLAPPKRAKRKSMPSMYDAIAKKLRAQPKRWGRIRRGMAAANAQGTAARIKSGDMPCFAPKGSYEAQAQFDEETNAYDLYARFVGQPHTGRPRAAKHANAPYPQLQAEPAWLEQPPTGPANGDPPPEVAV